MQDQALQKTIDQIKVQGKGILAADESTGTIAKRFAAINVESTTENHRAYRELLFTTPGIEKFVSGVILFEETLFQSTKAGKPYKATIISAKTSDGRSKDFLITQSTVNKAPDMQAALSSLSMGDTATIVEEAREGTTFTNIVGVHKGDVPDAASQLVPYSGNSSGSTATSSQKKDYDSSGAQVGNALKNACLMLANKAMKGSIESVAEEILRVSERLQVKLKAGAYSTNNTSNTTTQNTSKESDFVVDDSIPWD